MSQSSHTDELPRVGHWVSPITWIRIVASVWLKPTWYWSNIFPRLTNKTQVKIFLAQTILGSIVIGFLTLAVLSVVIQFVAAFIPLNVQYFAGAADILLLIILPTAISLLLYLMPQPHTSIPAAAIAISWSMTYALATLASLATLLVIRANPESAAASHVMRWPFAIGIVSGATMAMAVALGFINAVQVAQPDLHKWNRLRNLWALKWRCLFGLLWLTCVLAIGVLDVVRDVQYNPNLYPFSNWIIPMTGAIAGWLWGVSLGMWFRKAGEKSA